MAANRGSIGDSVEVINLCKLINMNKQLVHLVKVNIGIDLVHLVEQIIKRVISIFL